MKILYFFAQYNTPMYLWQNTHIVDELKHHGINVEIFNPLHFESMEQANETVLQHIKQNRYDLFMTCETEKRCFAATVEQVKSAGIPTLLICFDNLVAPYMHRNICRNFDLVWLTSKENSNMFKRWGAKTIFLPYAANPYAFGFNPKEEMREVVFLGTPYGSRANTINALTHQEVPVTLFYNAGTVNKTSGPSMQQNVRTAIEYLQYPAGRKLLYAAVKQKITAAATLDLTAGSLTQKPGVPCEKTSAIYSDYAMALSSTSARNTGVLQNPVEIVNLRSFEIPMSGGIQFCCHNKELAEYFEDDKEIIFYRTEEEMIDKARFYLNPEQAKARMQIRQAARKRAEEEHTWFQRFSAVFEILGIRIKN